MNTQSRHTSKTARSRAGRALYYVQQPSQRPRPAPPPRRLHPARRRVPPGGKPGRVSSRSTTSSSQSAPTHPPYPSPPAGRPRPGDNPINIKSLKSAALGWPPCRSVTGPVKTTPIPPRTGIVPRAHDAQAVAARLYNTSVTSRPRIRGIVRCTLSPKSRVTR
jgi:hypothetical protein